MADQLATPQDLAALLQQDLDASTAAVVLEAATAVVQEAAGGQRILEVEDDEFQLVGGLSNWLDLPQRPVQSVASVGLDGTALSAGTASGTYRLSGASLYRDLGWYSEIYVPADIAGVYTHGYPAGHQGLQLARHATLSLARAAYANPSGVAREQIDDYAVAFEAAAAAMQASPAVRAALRRQYGRRASFVTLA